MRRVLTIAIALVLAVGTASAAPPGPPSTTDVLSARSLGLAAVRGVAMGNDAVWLNPAAMAARRRYSGEVQYATDRNGAAGSGAFYGVSVVDSDTGPVSGGVAWTRVDLPGAVGNKWDLAVAGTVMKGLCVGVAGEFLTLGGAERVRAGNVHAGLFWEPTEYLALGVTGNNLVPTGHEALAPTGWAAGLSVGSDRSFLVASDWRGQWDPGGTMRSTWAAGAELLLGDAFPVRLGWTRDEWRDGQWWSAGVGFVSGAGVAVDVSYRQAIGGGSNRVLAAGVKLFLKVQ